jgi:hypothetical protein
MSDFDRETALAVGAYGLGFVLALANVGGSVIPLGVSGATSYYFQWGDLLAVTAGGFLIWRGHIRASKELEVLGIGLIVLDFVRVWGFGVGNGSPLAG